ncbi:MAG: CmcJ/NvfI family oxidoreductase [Sphingomonas sp.]
MKLNGFLPEGFVPSGPLGGPVGAPWGPMGSREVAIGDARALQAGAASEAEFLAEHGFVLLPHVTAVRDWDADIQTVYLPEIGRVIRERLFPGKRVEFDLYPGVLRRGRDTPVPFYAEGVHSDGGAGAEDYAHNIAAFAGEPARGWWLNQYARNEVEGLVWLDFWRTTNMAGPLAHMPLALCDISSLDAADLMPTSLTGIAPEGRETHHMSLRFNPGQRWYSYRGMTPDEMLVFKLGEFWKAPHRPGNCFHSAFADPMTPADAEPRQSCEYRVGVTILRD